MARSTMDFAQQNTERATDWMRAIAEQNLNQSKAAFDGLLTVARKAVRDVDQQTAAICEHSMTFAEETLSNTFDFAHKLMHMKEPQELAQIQCEFVAGTLSCWEIKRKTSDKGSCRVPMKPRRRCAKQRRNRRGNDPRPPDPGE